MGNGRGVQPGRLGHHRILPGHQHHRHIVWPKKRHFPDDRRHRKRLPGPDPIAASPNPAVDRNRPGFHQPSPAAKPGIGEQTFQNPVEPPAVGVGRHNHTFYCIMHCAIIVFARPSASGTA